MRHENEDPVGRRETCLTLLKQASFLLTLQIAQVLLAACPPCTLKRHPGSIER